METSSLENKERLLRMIIQTKKKRKVRKVPPVLEIDGQPSIFFPTNTESIWYRNTEELKENLASLVKNPTIYSKEE